MATYLETISLDALHDIDKNIVYRDFERKGSPYTYVVKIIDINRDNLTVMFQLTNVHVDLDSNVLYLEGENKQLVTQAAHRVVAMLKEPVFTVRVNPDMVVVLRILKDVKKDFSVQTGCWLHFIWVSRTVSCYGLDSTGAAEYVQHIIDGVRRCAMSPTGYNGYVVTELAYERKFKNLLKKYVDYVESKSGAKLAIKKDDITSGAIVVQFYGIPLDIQEAFRVIQNDILTRSVDEWGPFPATPCAPLKASLNEEAKGNRQLGGVKPLLKLEGTASLFSAKPQELGEQPKVMEVKGMGEVTITKAQQRLGPVGPQGGSRAGQRSPLDSAMQDPAKSDSRASCSSGVESTPVSSETEDSFVVSQKKNVAMLNLFHMVYNAGVDTKWVLKLLRQIGTAGIDVNELVQFMETQLEVSESKLYEERMQKITTTLQDEA